MRRDVLVTHSVSRWRRVAHQREGTGAGTQLLETSKTSQLPGDTKNLSDDAPLNMVTASLFCVFCDVIDFVDFFWNRHHHHHHHHYHHYRTDRRAQDCFMP